MNYKTLNQLIPHFFLFLSLKHFVGTFGSFQSYVLFSKSIIILLIFFLITRILTQFFLKVFMFYNLVLLHSELIFNSMYLIKVAHYTEI